MGWIQRWLPKPDLAGAVLLLAGSMFGSMLMRMSLFPISRTNVVGSLLVLSSALIGCAAHDRADLAWKTVALTSSSSGQIDPLIVVVQTSADQLASVEQQLSAAGFDVRDGTPLEVIRTGDDQAGFARDLQTLSKLFPGAAHLVVQQGGQRCEVGDALLITPRTAASLPAVLARHHLQSPQPVVGATVRVLTVPRDDLLQMNERIRALRADPEIAHAEFDLITHHTLK